MDFRSSQSSVVIELRGVSFGYEQLLILERLSFAIRQGEWIGVIGPNGGGKTTLLRLLMGFLTPSEGKILVGERPPKEACTEIGYVPQSHRVDRDFPITVWESILLGALSEARPWRGYPTARKARAEALMEQLGLSAYRSASFSALSGGLAQRALLARALVSDPPILLLDEPTAHVDAASSALICALLDTYKGKKTILLVTHEMKTLVERVDRVLCVDRTAHFSAPSSICSHVSLGLFP